MEDSGPNERDAARFWQSLIVPDHIVWNDVEGDLVLFDSRRQNYYTLDETASAIWRCIALGGSYSATIGQLCARYDAPKAVIAADALSFAQDALEAGFLTAKDDSAL
jgi:hypothetical protein